MDKIEKLRKDHELKMEILKLKGEQAIEENRIKNSINLDICKAKKQQNTIVEEIRQLKINVNKDKKLVMSGRGLLLFGAIATFISSMLTISGLWNFFNTSYLKLITFVSVILLAQFTVYIVSKHISTIQQHFIQHLNKANLLRITLLFVSIYGNYVFFMRDRETSILEKFITLLLCICIDLIAVYSVSLGNDFKTLNKNICIKNDFEVIKILWNTIWDKVTRSHKNKTIDMTNVEKTVQDKHIECTENDNGKVKKLADFVQDKDTRKVKSAILSYKDGNVCPSISALEKLTGLTKNEIVKAKKILEKSGLIQTKGKVTYIC